MKSSRYTSEQIALALRQAEGGTPVLEVCRKMGVAEQCRLSATMGHWNGQKNPRELRMGELPG